MYKNGILKITSGRVISVILWLKNFGGVHVWTSADLDYPDRVWLCSACNMSQPSPHAVSEPALVTDPAKIIVVDNEEACDPIRVIVQRGPRHNPHTLTPESLTAVNKLIEIAGDDAFYEVDVNSDSERVARIFRPIKETPLLEYGKSTTTTSPTTTS